MIYWLKVTLAAIRPAIWRRIRVPGGVSLRELHGVIQVAMGWGDEHMHSFTIGGATYGRPDPMPGRTKNDAKTPVAAVVAEGDRFVYTYDFGDSWEHEIVVEDVVEDDGGPLPTCVAGERACPPEDCGGAWGYGKLLEAVRDPKQPGRQERLAWLGGGFDPEEFDIEEVNRRLARLGDGLRERLRLRALKEAARKRSGRGRARVGRRSP